MRESWTDARLDDLNGKVDALRVEMRSEFAAVRGEIASRFDKVDDRLYAMQRLMIQFCGVALAALLGVLGALVAVAIQL